MYLLIYILACVLLVMFFSFRLCIIWVNSKHDKITFWHMCMINQKYMYSNVWLRARVYIYLNSYSKYGRLNLLTYMYDKSKVHLYKYVIMCACKYICKFICVYVYLHICSHRHVVLWVMFFSPSSCSRFIFTASSTTHCNTLQHIAAQCNTLQHLAQHMLSSVSIP